ncbi:hypothetical protein AB0K80_03780 [Streptomyces sp. NPDC052682]|uniref:hypothetical protein n=1 Tax=Streptomyces sp. NPDC052682 TaxID=3154954 RepID=UPI0034274504
MTEQQGERADQASAARRRRAEVGGFVVGLVAALAFFAFFPELPHVIDWGAIVVSLAVGAVGRWVCRVWLVKGGG